jgi:uncharacterized protein
MKVEGITESHFKGLVNVAQLLKEPVGSSRKYNIHEIIDEPAESSIEGELTLVRSGQGIFVRGELAVKVGLVCSRCLGVFPASVVFGIEEEFLPTTDVFNGLRLALSEESPNSTIDGNHMLDVGEVIRQYTLLNLPMKPLCRPDCTGIKEMD